MQKDTKVREGMISMINHWQQSGLNQKAYCMQHDVRYHVFHYWYKVYRNANASPGASFVRLRVAPSPGSACYCRLFKGAYQLSYAASIIKL